MECLFCFKEDEDIDGGTPSTPYLSIHCYKEDIKIENKAPTILKYKEISRTELLRKTFSKRKKIGKQKKKKPLEKMDSISEINESREIELEQESISNNMSNAEEYSSDG